MSTAVTGLQVSFLHISGVNCHTESTTGASNVHDRVTGNFIISALRNIYIYIYIYIYIFLNAEIIYIYIYR